MSTDSTSLLAEADLNSCDVSTWSDVSFVDVNLLLFHVCSWCS